MEGKKKTYLSHESAGIIAKLDVLLLRAKVTRVPKNDRRVIRLELFKELLERNLLHVSSIGSDVLLGDEIAAVETLICQHDPLAERELMAHAMMSYQSTPSGDAFPELPEHDYRGTRIFFPEPDEAPIAADADYPY